MEEVNHSDTRSIAVGDSLVYAHSRDGKQVSHGVATCRAQVSEYAVCHGNSYNAMVCVFHQSNLSCQLRRQYFRRKAIKRRQEVLVIRQMYLNPGLTFGFGEGEREEIPLEIPLSLPFTSGTDLEYSDAGSSSSVPGGAGECYCEVYRYVGIGNEKEYLRHGVQVGKTVLEKGLKTVVVVCGECRKTSSTAAEQ